MNDKNNQQRSETYLERLDNAIINVDNRVASLIEKLRKHDSDVALFDNRFVDDEQKIDEQFRDKMSQLSDADLQTQISKLQKELTELNWKKSSLETEYQQLETKKQKQQQSVNSVEAQLQSLESEHNLLAWQIANRNIITHIIKWLFDDAEKERKASLESQIQNAKNQKSQLRIVLNQLQTEINSCQTKQQDIRGQQQKIQNRENVACQEIDTLHKKSATLRQSHAESQRILKDNQRIRQAEFAQSRRNLVADFQNSWNGFLKSLDDVCKEIRSTQPMLDQLTEQFLNVSAVVPNVLSFGRLRLVLPENKELKKWRGFVPRLITFPFRKPLYAEFDNTLIHQLLLRLLFALPIGTVKITAIDPLNMGRSLAPFLSLSDTEELVPHKKFLTRSDEIESALQELFDYAEDLLQKRFQRDISNWMRYNAAHPDYKLPYKLLFIFGFPEQCSDKSILYLKRLIEYGPKCGILPIITLDRQRIDPKRTAGEIPVFLENNAQQIYGLYSSSQLSHLKYLEISEETEPFPGNQKLSEYLRWIQTAYKQHNQFSKSITDMWFVNTLGKEKSDDVLSTPLGWTAAGKEVTLQLGGVNTEHHVLLAGRSGSGKSNLLHVLIHGFVHRYASDELAIYLLDYKQGTEFNVYANPPIPQIKLVATESDTEYGITVLDHLCEELKRRAEVFKQNDVRDVKEYRKKMGQTIPRILLIIDEFQMLFQDNDQVTRLADKYFNQLLRQGRSFGIHVLLATQTLRGLQSTTSVGQLISQIGCRIALACNKEDSALILDGTNWEAADLKSPPEGIINNFSGQKSGNIRFNIPYADREIGIEHLQSIAKHACHNGFTSETKVFNGSRLPKIPEQKWFASFGTLPYKIVLGEELNFAANPFAFHWEKRIGNNLCVAGIDDSIRQGILRSVLSSVQNNRMFDRIIYYNSDPNWLPQNFSEFGDVQVNDYTWNGDITTLVSEIQSKRSLFIIDALDTARIFHPKAPSFGAKKPETATPADSLKALLDDGSLHGSFVLAFVDNWKRFSTSCKDYQSAFEMRLGFKLNEDDAGGLVSGSIARFKGLDNANKAIFVDRQKNRQVWFRPFIGTTEE